MPEPLPQPTSQPFPWPMFIAVALLLTGVVGVGVYTARSPAVPASVPNASAGAAADPSLAPLAPSSPSAAVPAPAAPEPESRVPTVGRLGVDKASCPAFAEIAGRFWDLKSQGTKLESVMGAIEQGSGGDERKVKLLKALAQVVYANATANRESAYRNALEACRKS
jgi:hypothetical protein